ncbi:MAG TPA: universal stress protein [Thermodesulfobacteriaceae bacterium]|nr:universal stress protein [Thermodesulfobacteriaceae bacterium]
MIEIKNILFPVDFTDASSKVAGYARVLTEKFEAKLHVIFVVEDLSRFAGFYVPHVALESIEKELYQGAQKKMESFVEEYFSGLPTVETIIAVGDVADKICEVAKEKDINLIVMGTHGRGGLEKVLFGSVAEKVVKTAPCPVLTVNPSQKK